MKGTKLKLSRLDYDQDFITSHKFVLGEESEWINKDGQKFKVNFFCVLMAKFSAFVQN